MEDLQGQWDLVRFTRPTWSYILVQASPLFCLFLTRLPCLMVQMFRLMFCLAFDTFQSLMIEWGGNRPLEFPLHYCGCFCFIFSVSIMQSAIQQSPGAQPPPGTLRHLESFFLKPHQCQQHLNNVWNNKSTKFPSAVAFRPLRPLRGCIMKYF